MYSVIVSSNAFLLYLNMKFIIVLFTSFKQCLPFIMVLWIQSNDVY